MAAGLTRASARLVSTAMPGLFVKADYAYAWPGANGRGCCIRLCDGFKLVWYGMHGRHAIATRMPQHRVFPMVMVATNACSACLGESSSASALGAVSGAHNLLEERVSSQAVDLYPFVVMATAQAGKTGVNRCYPLRL